MKVAALYDIHGNLPALEEVMREVIDSDIDEIIIGGDVVPGPLPAESMDFLSSSHIPMRFIRGNGDREVLAIAKGAEPTVPEQYREVMRWNAKELTARHVESIADWPPTLRLNINGLGSVLVCHATPFNDTEIFTRLSPEARLAKIFADVDADIVICGHTHMQFDIKVGKTRVVNAGSVGMPFGKSGAHWLLLGPEVEFRCTAYDLAAAASVIGQTDYPQREQFVETSLLNPPSEEHMLATFARVDGR